VSKNISLTFFIGTYLGKRHKMGKKQNKTWYYLIIQKEKPFFDENKYTLYVFFKYIDNDFQTFFFVSYSQLHS